MSNREKEMEKYGTGTALRKLHATFQFLYSFDYDIGTEGIYFIEITSMSAVYERHTKR